MLVRCDKWFRRCIQNPVKNLRWSVLQKQLTTFHKMLHLRCLGFWMLLWIPQLPRFCNFIMASETKANMRNLEKIHIFLHLFFLWKCFKLFTFWLTVRYWDCFHYINVAVLSNWLSFQNVCSCIKKVCSNWLLFQLLFQNRCVWPLLFYCVHNQCIDLMSIMPSLNMYLQSY